LEGMTTSPDQALPHDGHWTWQARRTRPVQPHQHGALSGTSPSLTTKPSPTRPILQNSMVDGSTDTPPATRD
jgi:hypothetical protein